MPLSVSGIGQIIEVTKGNPIVKGKEHQRRFKVVQSRGPTVIYDGEHPFDVYTMTIKAHESQIDKYDNLRVGTLIWIEDGKAFTTSNKSGSVRYWNVFLAAYIDDIKVIGYNKIGPCFEEHLRLGTNSGRNKS